MAKKTRIDRRGKIKSLVSGFKPDGRLQWRKAKTLAMLANRQQWRREYDPVLTAAQEILMEHLTKHYLVIEASNPATPHYIITE
jgi:hypothetical protein